MPVIIVANSILFYSYLICSVGNCAITTLLYDVLNIILCVFVCVFVCVCVCLCVFVCVCVCVFV